MKNSSGKYLVFCCRCVLCGRATSRKYAREHNGGCKACVTGAGRVVLAVEGETQAERDVDGAWRDNLGESNDY